MVQKYGRIAVVPEALPLAPRPITGELISSWLLRVSFANGLTLAQLIEAIETRFPGLSLQRAFIDDNKLRKRDFGVDDGTSTQADLAETISRPGVRREA